MKLFIDLSKVKKLLHIAQENPAVAEPFIYPIGPAYVRIIKRIQDQASIEHAHPRAVKALHALSKRPTHLAAPIVFSLRPVAERTVFVHSKD